MTQRNYESSKGFSCCTANIAKKTCFELSFNFETDEEVRADVVDWGAPQHWRGCKDILHRSICTGDTSRIAQPSVVADSPWSFRTQKGYRNIAEDVDLRGVSTWRVNSKLVNFAYFCCAIGLDNISRTFKVLLRCRHVIGESNLLEYVNNFMTAKHCWQTWI